MGTTPNLAIPYPEDTDLVVQGDDAMQAIAERLDAVLDPAWCTGYDETDAYIGTGITVSLPKDFGSEHFTVPGPGLIQYAGPTRLFLFTATVTIGTDTVGRQTTTLYQNATVNMRTNELDVSGGVDRTHVLTCALVLNNGDQVHVDAHATSGDGVVESTRVSIVSVGPAGAV